MNSTAATAPKTTAYNFASELRTKADLAAEQLNADIEAGLHGKPGYNVGRILHHDYRYHLNGQVRETAYATIYKFQDASTLYRPVGETTWKHR